MLDFALWVSRLCCCLDCFWVALLCWVSLTDGCWGLPGLLSGWACRGSVGPDTLVLVSFLGAYGTCVLVLMPQCCQISVPGPVASTTMMLPG